jgi:hypothetical protein
MQPRTVYAMIYRTCGKIKGVGGVRGGTRGPRLDEQDSAPSARGSFPLSDYLTLYYYCMEGCVVG